MADREEKRERILKALERLLPGRRFHEITLDAVAREAMIGKGTVYLYFKDKDALFAEMAFSRAEALCDALEALEKAPPADPALLLDRIGALIEDFLERHRSWFGAQTELNAHVMRLSQEYAERGKALRGKLLAALARLLGMALERPAEECADFARMLLWLIFGRSQGLRSGEAVPEWAEVRDFFWRGAGAIPAGPHKKTAKN